MLLLWICPGIFIVVQTKFSIVIEDLARKKKDKIKNSSWRHKQHSVQVEALRTKLNETFAFNHLCVIMAYHETLYVSVFVCSFCARVCLIDISFNKRNKQFEHCNAKYNQQRAYVSRETKNTHTQHNEFSILSFGRDREWNEYQQWNLKRVKCKCALGMHDIH